MNNRPTDGPGDENAERPSWQDSLGPPPAGLPYVPDDEPAPREPPSPEQSAAGPQEPAPRSGERLGPRVPPWQRESIPKRRAEPVATPPWVQQEQRSAAPAPRRESEHLPVRHVGPAPEEQIQPATDAVRRAAELPPEVQPYLRVEHRHSVEHSTPVWRLIGVVAAFGALGALGHYLDVGGHVEDAATLISVVIVFTVGFWAQRRPEQVQARFGPFGRIAQAIQESRADITRWVQERTLLAGVLVATAYGIGLIIVKHIVTAALRAAWSPWLAVAGGCIVGAAVVAPEMWRALGRGMTRQRR
ncbi:MAG TPA: hypothetical protein VF049_04980 [Nocardioidaceae bacterium]